MTINSTNENNRSVYKRASNANKMNGVNILSKSGRAPIGDEGKSYIKSSEPIDDYW